MGSTVTQKEKNRPFNWMWRHKWIVLPSHTRVLCSIAMHEYASDTKNQALLNQSVESLLQQIDDNDKLRQRFGGRDRLREHIASIQRETIRSSDTRVLQNCLPTELDNYKGRLASLLLSGNAS